MKINATNYKIRIEPDLETFKFSGSCEILLESTDPLTEVSLNILELAIWNCKVKVDGGFVDCSFFVSPDKEEMLVFLPGKISGEIILRIDYMGLISDKMAGFYRSKYTGDKKVKYLAVTQFEESDARRAFPSFDHPSKKAAFDLEMIIDEGLTAISNCPITEEYSLDNGKKSVRFLKTPVMSTYLVFFGVGEFEFIEDSGHPVVRVAALPGMTRYAEFGLEFGRKSLQFCEEHYGVKYPLPKLDFIAIPDFAFGAMENWGAITFRENLLLHFPDITSKAGEERICEVIAHEIAHQWFGNLVTPSDWKYLWLNESFATYYGYCVVNHFHPEWDEWDQFLHSQTETALDRDALLETIPIEIPGGEHVVINTSTAPIIYNKGGSILRQIKEYIGDTGFEKGLGHYLKKYEYSCASSRHLWESYDEVLDKPITKLMRSWVEQEGYPIIEAKRDGNRLVFTQKRFSYLPNKSDQEWLIPIILRIFYQDGRSSVETFLLENRQKGIDVGNDIFAYKVNDGQTGFYRVKYGDKGNIYELGKKVLSKDLAPEDRWGLQNDLYALVRCGDATIDDYLSFLSNYAGEDAFLPLISIANNLFQAYLVMEGEARNNIALMGKSLFEDVLSRIRYEPHMIERHTLSILRDQIMRHAVLYGSKDIGEFLLDRFSSLMAGQVVHPDILKSVMQIGALNGGHEVFEWFDKRLKSSNSEHDRMNVLAALGSFKDPALIERAQDYVLKEVPNRNKFILITAMASNPHAVPFMWDWYRSRTDVLEQFHPLHYERVIAGIIPICGLGKEEDVAGFFQDYPAGKNLAEESIRLSLERLIINSKMRGL